MEMPKALLRFPRNSATVAFYEAITCLPAQECGALAGLPARRQVLSIEPSAGCSWGRSDLGPHLLGVCESVTRGNDDVLEREACRNLMEGTLLTFEVDICNFILS